MILIHLCYFNLCLKYAINNFVDSKSKNQILLEELLLESQESTSKSNIPSDNWAAVAIKDIAYYLRDHKFNEWDRYYNEENPTKDQVGFFAKFPIPSLNSLHWEVKANCQHDFYKCIVYLHSVVETAPYSRVEDTAVIINQHLRPLNENIIRRLNDECKERHIYSQKIGLPFDDTLEKYQWRTSACYYMCWYTMLEIPALSIIGERCDNYANCLDSDFFSHNYDPRADDKFSFYCAMYSFCPDPCCPIKHIKSTIKCHYDKRNPCFEENFERGVYKSMCKMDRRRNQNLKDIINNKWNISCDCKDGYKWKSEFSMCVDVNECLLGMHNCDINSQQCLNLPGSFYCICQWGFHLERNKKICVKRNTTWHD